MSNTPIRDEALVNVLNGLPALAVLSLRECFELKEPALTRNMPNLHTLDCSITMITDAGIQVTHTTQHTDTHA